MLSHFPLLILRFTFLLLIFTLFLNFIFFFSFTFLLKLKCIRQMKHLCPKVCWLQKYENDLSCCLIWFLANSTELSLGGLLNIRKYSLNDSPLICMLAWSSSSLILLIFLYWSEPSRINLYSWNKSCFNMSLSWKIRLSSYSTWSLSRIILYLF